MSCSGLYLVLQAYYEYKKLEREFKRKLRRVMKKYGWM
jgi:hypothetical protein